MMEEIDDEIRESLLNNYKNNLIEVYQETHVFHEKINLSSIQSYFKDSPNIPEDYKSLSIGHHEFAQENIHVLVDSLITPKGEKKEFIIIHDSTKNYSFFPGTEGHLSTLLVAAFLVSILGSIIGYFLSKQISKPVALLSQRLRDTDPEKLNFQPIESKDEFGEISQIFASTLAKIEQVIQREKQFSQYASHELRTPVAIIKSSVGLWHTCDNEPESKATQRIKAKTIQRIELANLQMEEVIKTFLLLTRKDSYWQEKNSLVLNQRIDAIIERYKFINQDKNLNLKTNLSDSEISVNENAFDIIISNLLRNSFNYALSEITLTQHGNQLIIVNDIDSLKISNAEHYGFGLRIAQDLCKHIGWEINHQQGHDGGFQVTIDMQTSI